MRSRAVLVVAFAVVLGSASSVVGEDEDGAKTPRLAWNPLEKAVAGDWAFYSKLTQETREKRAQHPRPTHARVRIETVEGKEATLEASDSELGKPQQRSLLTTAGPAKMKEILDAFLCEREPKQAGFKTSESRDEKKKVGDKEFACTRLTGVWKREGDEIKVTAWMCRDCKPLGIVALELDGANSVVTRKQTFSLLGYGSGDKVAWGQAAAKNAFGSGMFGSLYGPGTPAFALEGLTPKGEKLALDPAKPTLVHFYSTWNDCELEIEWLAALKKAFAGLEVMGVASVAKDQLGEWGEYLKKHGADWNSVADVDGTISKTWNVERAETGSHATGAIFYFVHKGKLAGGDYCSLDYFYGGHTCTVDVLKKAYPGAKLPADLDPDATGK